METIKAILVASAKGGTGKTSLCLGLAASAERAGEPTLLYDADSQSSLTEWVNRRKKSGNLRLAEQQLADVTMGLEDFPDDKNGWRWVVIDSPPGDVATIKELIGDLVEGLGFCLIPLKPSPPDLDAATDLIGSLRESKVPHAIVFTHVKENDVLLPMALKYAKQLNVPVLKSRMSDLEVWSLAWGVGKTPWELGDFKGDKARLNPQRELAAKEIAAIWKELKPLVGKGARRD